MARKKKSVPAQAATMESLIPASVKIRHTPSGVLDDLAAAVNRDDFEELSCPGHTPEYVKGYVSLNQFAT